MIKKQYLRFGEIPYNEKSRIFSNGDDTSRNEIGVSCYEVIYDDYYKHYRILLPPLLNIKTLNDLIRFLEYSSKKIYIIEGDYYGIGSDMEPVLKNIKIIKEITKKEIYNNGKIN
jgi:hypothetical protein